MTPLILATKQGHHAVANHLIEAAQSNVNLIAERVRKAPQYTSNSVWRWRIFQINIYCPYSIIFSGLVQDFQ